MWNADAFTNSQSVSYSNAYSNSDSYSYSHCAANGYTNAYPDDYAATNAHTQNRTDAEKSSHAAAATLIPE